MTSRPANLESSKRGIFSFPEDDNARGSMSRPPTVGSTRKPLSLVPVE